MSPMNQKTKSKTLTKTGVLFFGRNMCNATDKALSHLEGLGFEVTFVKSKGRGESLPENLGSWIGDFIFCFRSLFVLPKYLIDKASIAAINFHPAPPEYPGSGCLNFALYDEAKDYGVTAHLMNEKVDNGKILACHRFPIQKSDTVDSLLERTHLEMLELFCNVTAGIGNGGAKYIERLIFESADEKWNGEARKVSELRKLQTIDKNATEQELERVIRATYTELYPPKVVLHGFEFVLKSPFRDQ